MCAGVVGGDWCWERDLWKHAHCSVCGSQFPRPKTAWSKGDGKSRQWETEWPALPSASQQRKWVTQTEKPKKVYGALNQVWNFIPEEAQQAIASAGFRVQLDANAAVQGNGKGNGKPAPGSKGEKGPGKGKGHPPYKELTPAQLETAKGLFESATDEQKEVLKRMGVEQPAQPTPDLAELCRQHIDALPESIKALLEKQTEPEKAPTVTETSRKFKVATEGTHPQEKHSPVEDQQDENNVCRASCGDAAAAGGPLEATARGNRFTAGAAGPGAGGPALSGPESAGDSPGSGSPGQ